MQFVTCDILANSDHRKDQIVISHKGPRHGQYQSAMTAEAAVELIDKLEIAVRRMAAEVGHTHPALVKLVENRRART